MNQRCGLLASLLLGGLLISCGPDASSDKGEARESGGVAVDTELDCVRRDYPCTWAEIEPAVIRRTVELADRIDERLAAGEATAAVAASLADEPDLAEVMHDSLLLRFRLEGGRAVWLGTPAASRLGIRGGGTTPEEMRLAPARDGGRAASPMTVVLDQQPARADPVGDQTPGDRPEKAFLFVDPYRWEYKTDVFAGRIDLEDDASHALPRLFGRVRDYKCSPGRRCDCPESRCYDYRGNDWANFCDPASPQCHIDAQVTLEDFKSWAKYDAIHVATHGYILCDATGSCANGIASGQFERGDLLPGPIPPGTRHWTREPGIDLWRLGYPPGSCGRLTPGTPGYSYAMCDVADALDRTNHRIWRVYMNLDFFKAAYPPGSLEDKLITLFACYSLAGGTSLADYLAGSNRENTVVGWSEAAFNSHMSIAATRFYELWLDGKTAREAFDSVRVDPDFLFLEIEGDGTVFRGVPSQTVGNPVPQTRGLDRKRGVETVYLLDPATGVEVADEGVLPLTTRPGDGRPDTLDALFEVVGIDPEEDPAQYLLRVRVDGRDVSATARFNEDVGDGVRRFRGVLDLGVDLDPDTPVDVEVSADLPDGGETRWMYYDVQPGGTCAWSATMGGATAWGGAIGGRWGGAGLRREGIGNPLGVDAWPGEGDPDDHFPSGPWLMIRLENRAYHDLSDMAPWREIELAIPAAPPGTVGTFQRVPARLSIGDEGSFAGNAQYLVRDVIGIPGGTGIGNLFTTDVTLTRNDTAVVEGTFQARFLNEDRIPDEPYARRPVGVGIHDFPDAEIKVAGEFRIAVGTECRTRVRRPGRPRRP